MAEGESHFEPKTDKDKFTVEMGKIHGREDIQRPSVLEPKTPANSAEEPQHTITPQGTIAEEKIYQQRLTHNDRATYQGEPTTGTGQFTEAMKNIQGGTDLQRLSVPGKNTERPTSTGNKPTK